MNLKKKSIALENGARLSYYDEGSGTPLVFCHGFGGNADNWTHPKSGQVQFFSDFMRVLAFDLKGYGDSDKSEDFSYTIAGFAQELHEAIENITNGEKIIFVGHSMGGMVAQEFALQFPTDLKGLVLVSTYSYLIVGSSFYKFQKWIVDQMEERSLEELEKYVSDTLLKQGVALLFYWDYLKKNPEMIEWALEEREKVPLYVLKADMYEIFGFNVHDQLPKITMPTLIIQGKRDQTVPQKYARKIQEQISGSELKMFDRCGHMVQFEVREELNFELEKFIASLM